MTPKRTVVVAVAVAVGVVASVLSYVFLNNAQQNAYHNAKLVPAYVITKAIPRTLTGDDAVSGGYISKKKVPAEFRPDLGGHQPERDPRPRRPSPLLGRPGRSCRRCS